MKKGTKVKLYIYQYSRRTFLGEGIYLGTEKRYFRFCHGVFPKPVKVFQYNDATITENECDWEKI